MSVYVLLNLLDELRTNDKMLGLLSILSPFRNMYNKFNNREVRTLDSIYSRADDWQKVLSLRTLLVRSVQHLVTYTKMFVCMSSFRIRLMTSSLMSTNRVTALEPYIPIITDYQNFAYSWQRALHLFLISIHN